MLEKVLAWDSVKMSNMGFSQIRLGDTQNSTMMACITDSHARQETGFSDALDHMKEVSYKISKIRMSSECCLSSNTESQEVLKKSFQRLLGLQVKVEVE